MKRIVVVGGGAGGLELVAQLSRYCRKHALMGWTTVFMLRALNINFNKVR